MRSLRKCLHFTAAVLLIHLATFSTTQFYFLPEGFGQRSDDVIRAEGVRGDITVAVNSATGKLFSGQKIRSFENVLRLQEIGISHSPRSEEISVGCDCWAVVTTIFAPSKAVQKVGQLAGWCLVIVADKKTPKDYLDLLNLSEKKDSIFFLSESLQMKMAVGDPFVSNTPWNHFGRKNIGYLYAIKHGAKIIFDFDDDNELLTDPSGATVLPFAHNDFLRAVEVGVSSLAFNPYPVMGAEDAWPRGFPLENIQDTSTRGVQSTAARIPLEDIAVVQLLANHDPDVDAIYRLTRKLPFDFLPESKSNAILLATGKFAPYNAQATIHTQAGLWATYLPVTVPGRVSDIWRGYFAECLFSKLGLRIAFAPPRVTQIRNAHHYLADMEAEHDLYFKTGMLMEFLREWEPKNENAPLPAKMEMLWVALYERGYIELDDVLQIQEWLLAMTQYGYKFPISSDSDSHDNYSINDDSSCALQRSTATIAEAVSAMTMVPSLQSLRDHLARTLLVITFNKDFYSNIPAILRFYSSWFPENQIVFIGPPPSESQLTFADKYQVRHDLFLEDAKHLTENIYYRPEFFLFRQEAKIMEEFSSYEGYIFASDDVILNLPHWVDVDFSRSSMLSPRTIFRNSTGNGPLNSTHKMGGISPNFPWTMDHLVELGVRNWDKLCSDTRFQKATSLDYTPNGNSIPWETVDTFYIAHRDASSFISFMKLCTEYQVHIEFAISLWFTSVLPKSRQGKALRNCGCYGSSQQKKTNESKDCSCIKEVDYHSMHPIKISLEPERTELLLREATIDSLISVCQNGLA